MQLQFKPQSIIKEVGNLLKGYPAADLPLQRLLVLAH